MRTEKEWAEKLAGLLTDVEFSEFAAFLDSCDDVEFSAAIADIDAKRNPYLYDNNTD